MKKIAAIICAVSLLCTMALPVSSQNQTRQSDIFDVLEILKYLVNIPNDAVELMGKEDLTVFDALEILKGLVGMREPIMIAEPLLKKLVCNCGDENCDTPWETKIIQNVTINDNFRGDIVLVMLDRKICHPRKNYYEPSFFGNLPIKEIRNLEGLSSIFDPELREEIINNILNSNPYSDCFFIILPVRGVTATRLHLICR